jgi:adhesin transport system outer membrane protein
LRRLAPAALLAFCGPLFAADDFDSLLSTAITTHPSVEGQRAGLQAARSDREGAEWQLYPTPSIQASARDSGGNLALFAIEQPLWTGGRITASIRGAGFREAAAEAAVVESKQNMAARLIAAYTEVLRQKARLAFSRRSIEEHQRLLALIGRRVEQEVSPPADQDFARSRLAQATTDLSVTEQALQVALVQLSQLVGRQVVDVDDVNLAARRLPTTEDEARTRAVETSPVLARLQQTSLAAVEDINVRRSVIMPSLAFRLERQTTPITVGSSTTYTDNRALIVLRAEPGAGLSAASNIAAAQSRYDQAVFARSEAERAVREQVQTAYAEWRAAQSRLDAARLATSTSESVFDSYSRQYVIGRKTWIDVLNGTREVTQSQFVLADSEALLRASALRLWLFTGEAPLNEPAPEVRR